jgi:N,N'-diacetylchitobiose transport system permease protein
LTSSEIPGGTAYAAEAAIRPRRRRPFTFARLLRASAPYLLILPVVAVIAAILGYPLYYLARLSFQKYGLFELIAHHGTSVGWANYSSVLHDHVFWQVLVRTVVFTIANVALTIGIGTLLALLLTKVSSVVRILLTAGLVLAWSMPPVVAVQVWVWITNPENGVLNYALTKLHVGDYSQHDWYATSFSQLSLTTSLVVWGAIPFVVVTVYAGLSQVSHELVEAAEIDGARAWRVFKDVTFPIVKPIFLILTSLSIIWDFGVFTQPFLLIDQTRINASNELMGIYLYEEGYVKTDFGRGAAISILMLLIVSVLSIFYVRKMVRTGDEAG